MTLLNFVVLAGSFLTATFLVVALYQSVTASRRTVAARLAGSTGRTGASRPEESHDKTLRDETYFVLGKIGRVISGKAYLGKVQEKLSKARVLMKAEELIGLSLVCSVAAALICWLLAGSLFFALITGIIGFKLPVFILDRRRSKRWHLLNQQLPDALDIISNGLRAGFSFTQALNVLTREMEPPISEEFARVIRKNQLGRPLAEVLREFSNDSDSDDLDMVITAILIQRQVGGNLAEILSNVAHTVRERVRIKGEIRTLTAQGRITAIVISLLPPGVMFAISIMNPGYIQIFFTEIVGMIMLGTAVFFQIVGITVLRRIINIDV